MRQNRNVKLVPSAARTAASGQSGDFTNKDATGALFAVKVNGTLTGTLVVKIQGKSASGDYYDLPGATSNALDSPTVKAIAVAQLPRTYRVKWDLSGTGASFTFAVDACLTV